MQKLIKGLKVYFKIDSTKSWINLAEQSINFHCVVKIEGEDIPVMWSCYTFKPRLDINYYKNYVHRYHFPKITSYEIIHLTDNTFTIEPLDKRFIKGSFIFDYSKNQNNILIEKVQNIGY